MRTATRLVGIAAAALALTGAGSTAFAAGDDPAIASEAGDGGAGGSGGIGLNVLCGINGTCDAGNGGAGGGSSSATTLGEQG